MSCCNHGIATQKLLISDNRVGLYTQPDNHPCFVSFRVRPGTTAVRCSPSLIFEQQSMSFYELLGIPETGSLLEMKQAYKKLARKYHPDLSPPGRVEEYTQAFIRVHEAYETLSDPSTRELYDRSIAKGLHLAFRRTKFTEEIEEKSKWKSQWQSQLLELKRRSMYKDSNNNMSWGAKNRRERDESSSS